MSALITNSPREVAIRKHAETLRKSFRITVASTVALGLELLDWKEELGTSHGGARGASSTNLNLKWPELVAEVTGYTYARCNDFMKAAKEVRKRFAASRKKGDADVKLIVQSPPSQWTDADYDAFADHVASAFEAETFKALMLDLFPPAPTLPPETDEKTKMLVQDDFYQAMLAADTVIATPIASLHRSTLNPAVFEQNLTLLPLEDIPADTTLGRKHIHGLLTLRHVLTTAGDQIDKAIKAKSKTRK